VLEFIGIAGGFFSFKNKVLFVSEYESKSNHFNLFTSYGKRFGFSERCVKEVQV
jgi:hypothetical protein